MENTPINYIEFSSNDLEKTKEFYANLFGWTFIDYGPEYCSFQGAGIDGGFAKVSTPIVNGVLVVLYHKKLEEIYAKVKASGARIALEIFSFPGGRRFHFIDPTGNELAIWSE